MTQLIYPSVTEKAIVLLEHQGKLQFFVSNTARKEEIKKEIERSFEFKVTKVQTLMNTHGLKKATIAFEDEKAAENILNKLGLM